MSVEIGTRLEVYSLDEIPLAEENFKYFACIGGQRNYECFLESKKLSRADFMKKYALQIDKCHIPIYEDEELIIRQDAQIPIPGFYIVATKDGYRKISEMNIKLYRKCLYYSSLVRDELITNFDVNRVFMYYDEHYEKPSSTHFWIMPIHDDVIKQHHLNPTILNSDIWKYQDLFEFQYEKEKIYETNKVMTRVLRKRS